MVRLLTTFMEQGQAPAGDPLPAPDPTAHVREEALSPDAFLALYREVGDPVQWDERLRMPPDALSALLQSDASYLFVLYLGPRQSGLLEALAGAEGEIEITNFGLVPGVQGRGLGAYFLDVALRALWAQQPRRLWLHSDTNDHPAAIKTYERAGFRVFDRRWMEFPD